jgi:hypothetical protein
LERKYCRTRGNKGSRIGRERKEKRGKEIFSKIPG